MIKKFLTSESVTEGHPDKVCDQISDSIVDAFLAKDPKSRVAAETMVTKGMVVIAGEITTSARAYINIPDIVRDTIKRIGYTKSEYGFDYKSCGIGVFVHDQSLDIGRGISKKKTEDLSKLGAGDQGLMYSYATNETPEYMPLPIVLAHKLVKQLAKVRKNKTLPYLRPDGKSQITIEYDNGAPKHVANVVMAAQHDEDISIRQLREDIKKHVINPIVPQKLITKQTKYFINATDKFVLGGPAADTGLTARKIIVDTYGGVGSHGGGGFSGKDPTKVDRSGSYGARWVAKNIVAAGLAEKVEVQIAYAIGIAKPLSINVDTYDTGKLPDDKIIQLVKKVFDLRPGMLIKNLKLRRPIYQQVAAYGHFGRNDLDLPWEKLNKVNELKKSLTHQR